MSDDHEQTPHVPTATHWGNYAVEVRDGVVEALHPDPRDPRPSPIGAGMPQAQRDEVRILRPHVREGWLKDGPGDSRRGTGHRGSERFVPVSWAEALELAASEIDRVRLHYGNSSIFGGSYGWGSAGRFHHAQSQVHRFLNLAGGYTRSVNSYSSAALEVILDRVAGGRTVALAAMPQWSDIAEHSGLVVAFGGLASKNAQVNSGGVSAHQAIDGQLTASRAGVRFINISPIRSDIVDGIEAEWLPLRPNTDVALMIGIAHSLHVNTLHDQDFLERCCIGWDRFAAYLDGSEDGIVKDAEWAAGITDIPADRIDRLAREIAGTRTVITASYSTQRVHHGEQSHWMALTLAAMSGSLGRPGGGLGVGLGSMHRHGLPISGLPVAALDQGRNAVTDFIPVARIADLLLHPDKRFEYNGMSAHYPDIRLVYWAGGNPFHHHQDLNRLSLAWQRPETVIVHDHWWNALARRADIVFPAATMLEREDIAWGTGEFQLNAMHRAVEPPGDARTDYDIFSMLAGRLGFAQEFTEGRSAAEWVRHLYERTRRQVAAWGAELPDFDTFWREESTSVPRPDPQPNPYELLRRDPGQHRLRTPSGRIEIFSETIDAFGYHGCGGHPRWMAPAEWLGATGARRFPLHLVSSQPATRLHSQYDNGGYSQSRKIAGREPILINTADAAARGIGEGDVVRVYNDRGACLAGAHISDEIRPGVVSLSTGAWYDPMDPAKPRSLDVHGNPNVVTSDRATSMLAQGTTAHTTLVQVQAFRAAPPPVTVFVAPNISD